MFLHIFLQGFHGFHVALAVFVVLFFVCGFLVVSIAMIFKFVFSHGMGALLGFSYFFQARKAGKTKKKT